MSRTSPTFRPFPTAALLIAVIFAGAAIAATKDVVDRKPVSVAPGAGPAKTTHAPYATGDCSLCHQRKDAKKPGPVTKAVNDLCFFCHEDVAKLMATGKFKHTVASQKCTNCHNPHSSAFRALLVADLPQLCIDCHPGVGRKMTQSKVRHASLVTGESCANCHNPHASNVEKILARLPYDQCVNCHGKDGVKDAAGKDLPNFRKLLEENPVQHAPVAQKDCSACHEPHGSDHTRMLIAEYPPAFYAPFDPANYALCFTCHEEKMVTMPETVTETRFRDGNRNLHFLHVNKQDRGRICRACHEVHAAKQAYLIRDKVPYGNKGFMLNVGFTRKPDGGTCDKTCHAARTYVNVRK